MRPPVNALNLPRNYYILATIADPTPGATYTLTATFQQGEQLIAAAESITAPAGASAAQTLALKSPGGILSNCSLAISPATGGVAGNQATIFVTNNAQGTSGFACAIASGTLNGPRPVVYPNTNNYSTSSLFPATMFPEFALTAGDQADLVVSTRGLFRVRGLQLEYVTDATAGNRVFQILIKEGGVEKIKYCPDLTVPASVSASIFLHNCHGGDIGIINNCYTGSFPEITLGSMHSVQINVINAKAGDAFAAARLFTDGFRD